MASPRISRSCLPHTMGRIGVTSIAMRRAPAPIHAGRSCRNRWTLGVACPGLWRSGGQGWSAHWCSPTHVRCARAVTARALPPRNERMRARSRAAVVVALAVLALPCVGPVWAQPTSPDQAIRLNQRQIQRHPRDATAYLRLGDAYIQKARQTGDLSYFTLAEQVLRKSLELAPRNAGAARHLAYVLSSRHQFVEAAEQAQKALDLCPTDSHAYGVLGDAFLELGRYDEAGQAFE